MEDKNLRKIRFLKNLGDNVKFYRKHLNLSQAELAEKIGVSKNYIGQIEKYKHNVSIVILFKLAIVFNVKFSDLLKDI